jgi:hypothetical protein
MLGWIIERTKMASIAGKWADATNLDPGDNGQVAVMASALIKATGMRAEDAWLSCLMKWMINHPSFDASYQIAGAMIRFLDVYEHSAGLSPLIRDAARLASEGVLGGYSNSDELSRLIVRNKEKASIVQNLALEPRKPIPNILENNNEAYFDAALVHIESLFCVDPKSLPGFNEVRSEYFLLSGRTKLTRKGALCLVERLVAYYVLYDAKIKLRKGSVGLGSKLFWVGQLVRNSNEFAVDSGDHGRINIVSAGYAREIDSMLSLFGIYI